MSAYEEAVEKMAEELYNAIHGFAPDTKPWSMASGWWTGKCRSQARAAAEAIGLREMMEALEPFAKYAMRDGFGLNHKGEPHPDGDGVGWVYLTNGDFCRAARALTPPPQ